MESVIPPPRDPRKPRPSRPWVTPWKRRKLVAAYDAWFLAENELTAFLRLRGLQRGPTANAVSYAAETLRGYYADYKVPLTQACERVRQLGYLSTDDMLAVTTAESLDALWAGMGRVTAKLERVRLLISAKELG